MNAKESGYNPLEYLNYECEECGDYYGVDEFDIEKGLCCYCAGKEDVEQP